MKSIVLRLIGHRFDTRFTWGEIGWHPRHWKLGFRYCPAGYFEHNMIIAQLLIVSFYVHLPTKSTRGHGCMTGDEKEYGFYTIDRSIVWKLGTLYKSFDWPFVSLKHWRTELLTLDRKRVVYVHPKGREDWEARKKIEASVSLVTPYTYTLKSGKKQERTATVHVERWTWRRKWAPFLTYVRESIDVSFSDEVGERTGSWKGGCVGCSYEMRPGESALETLRRMEAERIFN